MNAEDATSARSQTHLQGLSDIRQSCDAAIIDKAKSMETECGQFVPSGDYWNHKTRLNPDQLRDIDQQWIAALAMQETTAAAETV